MTTEQFVKLLHGVRQTARGWTGCCPAHNDQNPSLSIAEGGDNRILVRCWAGCSVEEICASLWISVRDLFPAQSPAKRDMQRRRTREWEWDGQRRKDIYRGVRVDLLRESEGLILTACNIHIHAWTPEKLNNELNRLADAYQILEEENQ